MIIIKCLTSLVFVKQILAVAGTDQFIGRLFSGGSRSSSDFIVQDFAVIMIVVQ